jgi:hypothetical protein
MLWGRGLAILGLLVFGLVAARAYIAYSRHQLGTAVATAIAGGTLAIALISVGESLGKRGGAFLRGEKQLVRSIGRIIGRRRSRRSRP